jgi:hypothetical protein
MRYAFIEAPKYLHRHFFDLAITKARFVITDEWTDINLHEVDAACFLKACEAKTHLFENWGHFVFIILLLVILIFILVVDSTVISEFVILSLKWLDTERVAHAVDRKTVNVPGKVRAPPKDKEGLLTIES